jgi:hypothetical protein
VLVTSLSAGTAAAIITAPIDNLKVRIQTQGSPTSDGAWGLEPRGAREVG